jgi:hypothetical protein
MAEAIVKDGRVQLRDERGGAFSVPEEQVGEALSGGEFRLETPDEWDEREKVRERSTLGQQAILGAEKFGRGATFGLSEAAAVGFGGEEYRRAAQERAEVNPGIAMAAEITGAVAPALLSGGAGALGTAARLTPAAQVGRAGLAAERLAARALAPLGESFAAQLAQKAARAGAQGAVEGAAYGLGTSLADSALEGTEWTAERALSGMADAALYGLGGGAALGAGGAVLTRGAEGAGRFVVGGMMNGGKTFRNAIAEWAEEKAASSIIGRGAADAESLVAKITQGGAVPERFERVAEKLRASLQTGSRGELASVTAQHAKAATARHASVLEELAAQGVKPDGAALRAEVAEAVESLSKSPSKDHRSTARLLSKIGRKAPETLADAERLQRRVDQLVTSAQAKGKAAVPELEQLSRRLSSRIDDAAEAAGPTAQGMWKQAREEVTDWKSLASHLGREKLTDSEVGRVIGLVGFGTSLATGSILPSLATAALGQSPAVRQFVRERGGSALTWLASRAGHVERTIASAARRIAGGDPVTAIKSFAGETVGKPAASARRKAVRAGTVAMTAHDRQERYTKVRDELNAIQRNPGLVAERIERALGPIAAEQPEVAFAMGRRIAEDYAWLASKLPQPYSTFGKSLQPHLDPPVVPPHEQAKIVRYAEALSNPPSVLESIAEGRVNWEGIEALKERRPDLWAGMREMVAMRVAESGTKLEYRKRILYSLAFEFTGDPMLERVGDLQASSASAQPSAQPTAAQAGALDQSTNQQTPYQEAVEAA